MSQLNILLAIFGLSQIFLSAVALPPKVGNVIKVANVRQCDYGATRCDAAGVTTACDVGKGYNLDKKLCFSCPQGTSNVNGDILYCRSCNPPGVTTPITCNPWTNWITGCAQGGYTFMTVPGSRDQRPVCQICTGSLSYAPLGSTVPCLTNTGPNIATVNPVTGDALTCAPSDSYVLGKKASTDLLMGCILFVCPEGNLCTSIKSVGCDSGKSYAGTANNCKKFCPIGNICATGSTVPLSCDTSNGWAGLPGYCQNCAIVSYPSYVLTGSSGVTSCAQCRGVFGTDPNVRTCDVHTGETITCSANCRFEVCVPIGNPGKFGLSKTCVVKLYDLVPGYVRSNDCTYVIQCFPNGANGVRNPAPECVGISIIARGGGK